MRVLGVDPGLRRTGFGVLDFLGGGKIKLVRFGVIVNPPPMLPSECLRRIHGGISEVIREVSPTEAAVEGVIYLQNYQTAITLGAARGAAILAMAEASLPVQEYAPRRIKSATTGRGGAQKQQVGFMIRALLGLTETPPPDAADAIAVAMTHGQSARGIGGGKRI